MHHDSLGTERNTKIGFFDSSLMSAAYKDTANVLAIKKRRENQK